MHNIYQYSYHVEKILSNLKYNSNPAYFCFAITPFHSGEFGNSALCIKPMNIQCIALSLLFSFLWQYPRNIYYFASHQHFVLHASAISRCTTNRCAPNLTEDCTNRGVRKRCLHICKSGLEANLVAGWLNRAARLPPILSPLALSGGER